MQYNNMIKILIILGGVLMILPMQVYANQPLPLAYPFNDGNQTVCYQTGLLNNVKFNGQTGQGNALANEIDKGRAHVSSNTDMNIQKINNCNNTSNEVYADNLGIWPVGDTAHTIPNNMGRTDEYKTIIYNSNPSFDFRTSSTCSPPSTVSNLINPKFIAIHEFGHFAGLDHPPWWEEPFISDYHTAMKSYRNSGYASLSQDDKNQINGFY
jgi:hypothetical protein